jgi:predicted nucleic acid-binding protein
MSTVLVDSNVLLDLLGDESAWTDWSASTLQFAGNTDRLIINPIIYGEVSVRFSSVEALDEALPETIFVRERIPFAAAFLAGKAFLAYRRRGGTRQSLLPDFLIGAHAAVSGYRLLTRDARRYRTYFPRIDLLAPAN